MVPATIGVIKRICAITIPVTVYKSFRRRSGPTPQNIKKHKRPHTTGGIPIMVRFNTISIFFPGNLALPSRIPSGTPKRSAARELAKLILRVTARI